MRAQPHAYVLCYADDANVARHDALPRARVCYHVSLMFAFDAVLRYAMPLTAFLSSLTRHAGVAMLRACATSRASASRHAI